MGVKELSLIVVAFLLTAIVALPASADQVQDGLPVNGCAIPTPQGLVADRDCDGVDDFHDNCKYAPNTEQSDSNRNSIGDACDLLVTQILLDPGTEVKQGSLFTVRVQLINNKAYEIKDVQTRIRNNGLQLDTSTFIDAMQPAEQRNIDFILKAPGCVAPGRYELTFTTDHAESGKVYTQTLYQRITVIKSEGACDRSAETLDNTLLETITQQEAFPGDRVVYPIMITNLNGEAKSYHLRLQEIGHIGSYRIDPASNITVAAGKQQGLYLYVETEKFAPLGRNALNLILEADGASQQTTLTLRVIKPVGAPLQQVLATALQLGLIVIVLGLVLAAGIIAYKRINGGEEPKQKKEGKRGVEEEPKEEEFQSYY